MKEKINSSRKIFKWNAILAIVLIFSSTFTLLDAFLIPKVYAVVDQGQYEYLSENAKRQ